MQIERFTFETDARNAFLDLPERLYAEDAKWLPPPRAEQERLLSPSNPFFGHGEMIGLLATEGGRAIGRCAAMWNKRMSDEGRPVGLVGFFECENNATASEKLLHAAFTWLREKGISRVCGPMNFSIWHSYRFMTRGFDRSPFFGEPYNASYYPEMFGRAGFAPLARWRSWDLTEQHLVTMRVAAAAAAAAVPGRFVSRPIDMDHFENDFARLHAVFVEGFANNVGASTIDLEEFTPLYAGLQQIMVPELVRFVPGDHGDIAVVGVAYPDVGDFIRAMRGVAPPPTGPGAVILHSMTVAAPYRKRGAIYEFIVQMIDRSLALGHRRGIGALATEGPTLFSKTGDPSREYTLYARDL